MKTVATLQAIDVADWFIVKANEPMFIHECVCHCSKQHEAPESISHIKLQRLLYFSQAAHLSLYNQALFEDKIEAWRSGPVIPNVYQTFKSHGSNPLEKPQSQHYKTVIDEDTEYFLEQMWEIFGKFSGIYLVAIIHEHTPWQTAYKSQNRAITTAVIKKYYKPLFQHVG